MSHREMFKNLIRELLDDNKCIKPHILRRYHRELHFNGFIKRNRNGTYSHQYKTYRDTESVVRYQIMKEQQRFIEDIMERIVVKAP
jgi:hypothetical protein